MPSRYSFPDVIPAVVSRADIRDERDYRPWRAPARSSAVFLPAARARATRYWNQNVFSSTFAPKSNCSSVSTSGLYGATAPTTSDVVFFSDNSSSSYTITLNTAASTDTFGVGNNGGGTNTLNEPFAINFSTPRESLGYAPNSSGAHTQSAGTHTHNSWRSLGENSTGTDTYTLSNIGVINLTRTSGSSAIRLNVGGQGTGTFNQFGGTVNASVPL